MKQKNNNIIDHIYKEIEKDPFIILKMVLWGFILAPTIVFLMNAIKKYFLWLCS